MKEKLVSVGSHEDIVSNFIDHKNSIGDHSNQDHKDIFPEGEPRVRPVKKVKALYDMYTYMSAIQKSIRWCDVNDSRYFAKKLIEMGKPGAVINRLLVIASEDVGLADPSLLQYVRTCSDIYEGMLKEFNIKRSEVSDFPSVYGVIDQAVTAAALSYKSRLLPMMTFVTLFDIYKNEKFKYNLSEYLDLFRTAVQIQNDKLSLYYAFIVVVVFNAEVQLFTIVHKESARRNTDLIREWVLEYRRSKELMVLAGIVAMLCRDLDYSHGEYHASISDEMSLPIEKSDIPNRAFDKHTVIGRKKGRGYRHFFKEAASVKHERFPNDWKEMGIKAYLRADKEGLDKVPDLIEAINNNALSRLSF